MKCSVFACVSLYFIHNTYWFIELVSAAHAYILNDPLILIEKKKISGSVHLWRNDSIALALAAEIRLQFVIHTFNTFCGKSGLSRHYHHILVNKAAWQNSHRLTYVNVYAWQNIKRSAFCFQHTYKIRFSHHLSIESQYDMQWMMQWLFTLATVQQCICIWIFQFDTNILFFVPSIP